MAYSSIECRTCGQGLLEFFIRVDTGDLYLECDERMTGFAEVVDGRVGKGVFAGEVMARPATLDEISAAGLEWSSRR